MRGCKSAVTAHLAWVDLYALSVFVFVCLLLLLFLLTLKNSHKLSDGLSSFEDVTYLESSSGVAICHKESEYFIRDSKRRETAENTRPQAECFYCFEGFKTPDEARSV